MELFNRVFGLTLIHRVLILFTLILSGPEAIAPQLQTDQITQKTFSDFLTEIDRPTVEAPAREASKKPRFQFVFLPTYVSISFATFVLENHIHFSSIRKNQFLVSASARGPPLS